MPLEPGSSRETIRKNIRELMHSFKAKRKIGTSTPASTKKAAKQAAAIAYRKAREGK